MRIAIAALLLSVLGALPPARSADAPRPLTRADAEAWLDGFLPYALEQGDIAGAAVAIVAGGELLTARGYGLTKPLVPNTTPKNRAMNRRIEVVILDPATPPR